MCGYGNMIAMVFIHIIELLLNWTAENNNAYK